MRIALSYQSEKAIAVTCQPRKAQLSIHRTPLFQNNTGTPVILMLLGGYYPVVFMRAIVPRPNDSVHSGHAVQSTSTSFRYFCDPGES